MMAEPNDTQTKGNQMTLRINATECDSANDAITQLNFSGDHAISLAGRFFVVTTAELDRLESLGIQPTKWHHHEDSGLLMSVPGRN
jgi:hypothetical protein